MFRFHSCILFTGWLCCKNNRSWEWYQSICQHFLESTYWRSIFTIYWKRGEWKEVTGLHITVISKSETCWVVSIDIQVDYTWTSNGRHVRSQCQVSPGMDLFTQRIFVWVKIKIFVLWTEFSYQSYLLTVCKTCSLCAEVGFILFCILYISSSLYILFGIPSFAFKYQCHLHPSSVSRVINNKAFDCNRTDTNSGVNFWVFKFFFFSVLLERPFVFHTL